MPIAQNWMLNYPGIEVEQAPGNGHAIGLSHPAYPNVRTWNPASPAPEKALVRIAGQYLEQVRQKFDFPPGLTIDPNTGKFQNQPSRLQLTWMPIAPNWIPSHGSEPRNSFWFKRIVGGVPKDLSIVLVAVPTLTADDPSSAIGSRMGVRVTARVLPQPAPPFLVGVTSSSCSNGLVELLGPAGAEISPDLALFLRGDFKSSAKAVLRALTGLKAVSPIFIEGIRVLSGSGDDAVVDIYAHIPRGAKAPGLPAEVFTARASVRAAGQIAIDAFQRSSVVAHQRQADLLVQDPPSDPVSLPGRDTMTQRRASRSPQELNVFASPTHLPGLPGGAGPVALSDDLNQVEVRESELLDGDPAVVRTVQLPLRDPRTDDFSAVSAYLQARLLFDRIRSCGLIPDDCFRFARFPLIVRYRATITDADDGRTVNAAVDYDPPRVDFGQGWGVHDLREPLQVRYALADLKRSAGPAPRRDRLNPAPDREPLGIAADPRWSWHEFGHVLLAAATGALELPFAHSVGDALAAIACDPQSRLSHAHLNGQYRGLTFPWIHATRRHDREVGLGWGWCGTYHRPLRIPEYRNNQQRKGYHSEQILSSSLFRLYRALGGDTVDANGSPDAPARQRAADYVIYLIIRAVMNLPAAVAGSAETPEQLVALLMAADVGTEPENGAGGLIDGRVGGWAHKVIRWAFEAQGLYGAGGADVVNNAPGEPPDVDVFIDNGRPDAEGSYPRGGYMPVSLNWGAVPGLEPWLAHGAMNIANGRLRVTVRNRNGTQVNHVRVRAWYAAWPQAQANPPDWDPLAAQNPSASAVWHELGHSPSPQRTIPAGQPREFPAFNQLPNQPGRYVVLAAVLCDLDRPNIMADMAQPLPTASNATPLVDLVAGDNNLGLLVLNV